MNLEEENKIRDFHDFLHSEHSTLFEYNQEKLGSENIHASVSWVFNSLGLNSGMTLRIHALHSKIGFSFELELFFLFRTSSIKITQ